MLLADALEKRRGSVLVLDADAEVLTPQIYSIVAPQTVWFCDFRDGLSDSFGIAIEQGLRKGALVHVAIDRKFDRRLYNALWNLDHGRRHTGEGLPAGEGKRLHGRIVVSTAAPRMSEIESSGDFRDLFGFVVGRPEHHALWTPKPLKQAIVVVHGIGRQRPKETFRKFAEAVVGEDKTRLKNKPDDRSQRDIRRELRKFVYQAADQIGPGGRLIPAPTNEFFEYYWADAVEGTTFDDVRGWFWGLLRRKPPPHLVPLWAVAWLTITVFLGALALGVGNLWAQFTGALPPLLVALASFVGLTVYRQVLLETIGDVCRYLEPEARNISVRRKVRDRGLALLRNLIASGEYDRIVVVGHSLGSAIAYDVLRVLWEEDAKPLWLKAFPVPRTVVDQWKPAGDSEPEAEAFQARQLELRKKVKEEGHTPWPITDLITIGSPLAHAALLLPGNLEERQNSLEYPTSPPMVEEVLAFQLGDGPRHVQAQILHRAGMFAITRWTNIYAPARFGIFGDLIAGPLQEWFGLGVRDRPVATGGFIRSNTLAAHTSYWRPLKRASGRKDRVHSLEAIIEALDLGAERLGLPGRGLTEQGPR